jgi:hypothetical protein
VHVVLDNSSTHKTPAVKTWLLAHPRFVLHFTSTSSSWLNLVERWFSELTSKKLRHGAHRSVRQLNTDIREWIDTWNDDPKPYVWTKTTDQILESIARYCDRFTNHDTSRAVRLPLQTPFAIVEHLPDLRLRIVAGKPFRRGRAHLADTAITRSVSTTAGCSR